MGERVGKKAGLKVTQYCRAGRPRRLTEGQRATVRAKLAGGASVAEVAKAFGVSRQTIMRARDTTA